VWRGAAAAARAAARAGCAARALRSQAVAHARGAARLRASRGSNSAFAPRCKPPSAWASPAPPADARAPPRGPLRPTAALTGAPAAPSARFAPRQAGETTLKLVDNIRALAKSATELSSRGLEDAAAFLHDKLWQGACCVLAARLQRPRRAAWRAAGAAAAALRAPRARRTRLCAMFAATNERET
jgi:hypothetical protein